MSDKETKKAELVESIVKRSEKVFNEQKRLEQALERLNKEVIEIVNDLADLTKLI